MSKAENIKAAAENVIECEHMVAQLEALDPILDGRRFDPTFQNYDRNRPTVINGPASVRLARAMRDHFSIVLDTARHLARQELHDARAELLRLTREQ